MPTGTEAKLKTESIAKVNKFFQKYQDLFTITRQQDWDKETKMYNPNPDKLSVLLNTDSVEQLQLLRELLQEKNIPTISDSEAIPFRTAFNLAFGVHLGNLESIHSLFDGVKSIIDRHNLYFNKCSQQKITRIINNTTIKAMYDTSIAPSNLTQSQVPIDAVTEPLKEIAETRGPQDVIYEAKHRTPGNFINKFESITENQVGKDGISICATGLKSFFALTQYYNQVLNNGTIEEQQRLVFKGPDTQNTLLAGVRALDPSTILHQDVLDVLSTRTNEIDPVLTLSALLSLATDNAKELKLAKLNAGPKTLGMYIFGITAGMDFETISNTMMSDAGFILAKAVDSNVYNGSRGCSSILKAIDHFTKHPNMYTFGKYNVRRDQDNQPIASPLSVLELAFKNSEQTAFLNGASLYTGLTALVKSKDHVQEVISIFETMRDKYKVYSHSAYGIQLYNSLIDAVEDYAINSHKLLHDKNTVYTLKYLAAGAEELKLLGQILGLNQGIKTDNFGYLQQIHNIENLIVDKTGDPTDRINFLQFINDPEYRQKCIERYENVKTAFNILDVIASVPHFFQYFQTLAISQKENQLSFKFRSIEQLYYNYRAFNRDEQKLIKGIQNFIGDYTRDAWLGNKGVAIEIPKEIKTFDSKGKLSEDTTAWLGTDFGNASFRRWFELQVIPDLKEGKIKPGVASPFISGNKFIQDLTQDINTHTVSQNASIIYTLPINMLPRSSAEQNLLDTYMSEFNKLSPYFYEYETTVYSGKTQKKVLHKIPLTDLFTYYSMIAHDWKLGEKSLVPILKGFQNKGLLADFHAFEKELDMSNKVLTRDSCFRDDILPYIVPYDSPYTSSLPYIRRKDPSTQKVRMMRLLEDEEMDMMDSMEYNPNIIGNYEYTGSSLDTNYFTTGQIKGHIKLTELDPVNPNVGLVMFSRNITETITNNGVSSEVQSSLDINIHWKRKGNTYTASKLTVRKTTPQSNSESKITTKDLTKEFTKMFKTIPDMQMDGEFQLDIHTFNSYLDHLLNPCH